jgi:hypothetical protein
MTDPLDAIDWKILDALSDDYEPMEQIVSSLQRVSTPEELLELDARLSNLVRMGFVETSGTDFELYSLTSTGSATWERLATSYSDKAIDWSEFCASHIEYKTHAGRISGTTESVCMSALDRLSVAAKLEIDQSTIRHEPIEGFWAKYHKWLPGGHQITFRFQVKPA